MTFEITNLIAWVPLLTSIVALGTLWNVSRQRIISNRPDLHVKSSKVEINYNLSNKIPHFVSNTSSDDFFLPLYNIGLGTAKDISITWLLKHEDITRVKLLDVDNEYFIENGRYPRSRTLEIKKESIGVGVEFMNLGEMLVEKIDFILPYKADQDTLDYLRIHPSITTLLSILCELKYNKKNDIQLENFQMSFDLKYKDINGKNYHKKLIITLDLSVLNSNYGTGRITVE